MELEAVKTEATYTQLCVLHAVILKPEDYADFENFILEETGCRIKVMEVAITNPDPNDPTTGGRHDVLFYVHPEDVEKFAVPRFKFGIRWWEDVIVYNNRAYLYSNEILKKYPPTW